MFTRDARFRQLIADAFAAIEQGDLRRARELICDVPDGRRSEATRLLLEHRADAEPDAPPDLLFDLFEQAQTAAVSRIREYGQGPLAIRRSR